MPAENLGATATGRPIGFSAPSLLSTVCRIQDHPKNQRLADAAFSSAVGAGQSLLADGHPRSERHPLSNAARSV